MMTPTIFVVGSLNVDLVVRTQRLPRSGETVMGTQMNTYPGGKGANQAVAAAKLGARTKMVGRVGTDSFGETLRTFLGSQGVDVAWVIPTGDAPTGVAMIVVAESGENSIVVAPGANGLVAEGDVADVPLARGDVVVCQFEIPSFTVERVLARARTSGATTIVNAAPARPDDRDIFRLADVLIVNELELAELTASGPIDVSSVDDVARAAIRLRTHAEQIVVTTLGGKGALAIAGDRRIYVEGRQVAVVDTTGAGDAFVGAIAARISAGATIDDALAHANTAASICVQRHGAGPSMPIAAEVDGAIAGAASSWLGNRT